MSGHLSIYVILNHIHYETKAGDHDMQKKKVKSLMEDYKQFAFTLLSVSAFFIYRIGHSRTRFGNRPKGDNDARDMRLFGRSFLLCEALAQI